MAKKSSPAKPEELGTKENPIIVTSIDNRIWKESEIGDVVKIGGVVMKHRTGEGKLSTYDKFIGDFVVLHDGKFYRSNTAYLPPAVTDSIIANMAERGNTEISFTLTKEKSDNKYGYQWVSQSNIEAKKSSTRAFDLIK